MIIASGELGKAQMLIFGLSAENIKRLQQYGPILMSRESHGDGVPEGWKIAIIFGETEAEIAKQLKEAGLLGPETKIHKDPRL